MAAERIRIPKGLGLGGWGIPAAVSGSAVSKCPVPVGRTAAVIDSARLGLKGADARNRDPSHPAPARTPLFPSSILDMLRSPTGGSLFGMKPLGVWGGREPGAEGSLGRKAGWGVGFSAGFGP